jgi:hypothetical protein
MEAKESLAPGSTEHKAHCGKGLGRVEISRPPRGPQGWSVPRSIPPFGPHLVSFFEEILKHLFKVEINPV